VKPPQKPTAMPFRTGSESCALHGSIAPSSNEPATLIAKIIHGAPSAEAAVPSP